MKIEISDMRKAKMLFAALSNIGYKILLRDYECALGSVDFVAKKNGVLCFIGIDKTESDIGKVAQYYVKRYGIHDVKTRTVIL